MPPYVVGIGASAGGLEALERFFANVPTDSGMAFVVIQHLSPDFRSLMDELLARRTKLPIALVEDGMAIEPDHVYLIPPKKEMIISGGRLLLSERERKQELTLPIDVFFRSLAQDCGARAIAIVLSGGGSDGSRGIRDVHDAGGVVLVQDTDSAQFDGMPKTARDAGVATWVLAPEDMPRVLIEHTRRDGLDAPTSPAPTPIGMAAVYHMLQSEYGLDFKDYKPSTVTRRIDRRLQMSHASSLDRYVERLRDERAELDVLYRDLLIGVTRFFRDEDAFLLLERDVLPQLVRGKDESVDPAILPPLRVWVAGCATGEEAYSIAILLHELGVGVPGGRQVKVFATDVHRGSLETAARGMYDEDAVANVTAARLARYFRRVGSSYQVIPEVRQMLVFAPHNVIKDPPFTRVDLVSCRNMLIYLLPAAQQKVLSYFHFALNRDGMMVLGPSESPGVLIREFETVDAHWRLYRKRSDVRTPVDTRLQPARSQHAALEPVHRGGSRHALAQLLGTYDAMLERYMPPGLLLDERGGLVHAFGGAHRFLRLQTGRQGLDVLELVDSELRMALVSGLARATREPDGVVFAAVRIQVDDTEERHRVTIRSVASKPGSGGHLLVTFEQLDHTDVPPNSTPDAIEIGSLSREQVTELEAELDYTRENLQAAIEELETSNEELQAANEELLASNEELQSTNEELQSVNEELYTVNAEYQRKIEELTELTNDMDNLLAATDVGTIFLDNQLKVRKFTPQIGRVFNLLAQDIGRPIETFTHSIDHPGLMDDLRSVLRTGERIERELRDAAGQPFFLRVLPYRTHGGVDGVVLTLIDTAGLKAAQDALFHERYLLESLLGSVPDAIYFSDLRGRFIRANKAMALRCGESDPNKLVGRTPFDVCDDELARSIHEQDQRVVRTGEVRLYDLEHRTGPDNTEVWDLATRLPLRDSSDRIVGVIAVLRDVSEQRRSQREIEQAVHRRDQFLAMLSHELRNPLAAIVMATSLLRDGSDPKKGKRMLATLERQSTQMARLLDDLLEASRVTQDKIELRKSTVDIVEIARDAADAARELMGARGVQFAVELADEPLWVVGDAARLQQIQVNMLSNAAKYTPSGGHVLLQVHRDGDDCVLSVRDNGVGIPQDMLDKVFDLFVQSGRTLDRSDGGLGLGLTLVRSLVQMHGGSVCVSSDGEGKGSVFDVRLPLTSAPAAADVSPSGPTRSGGIEGRRVVVIEDNDDSRELLCHLLSSSGYECEGAGDGMAGVELISSFAPAVAVVDIGLPGADGFEVAKSVRQLPHGDRIYLVALTGYGQATDRERALAAGFDEHLVKPVKCDALLTMLESAVRPA
jgi:two-component system CheB/CheR fusion protein